MIIHPRLHLLVRRDGNWEKFQIIILNWILCICYVLFTEKGLDHVAENILSYLDAESLGQAELVCKEWHRVISEGMLWKKLIERKVKTDPLWRGLAERRGWWVYCQTFEAYICWISIFNIIHCIFRVVRIRYLFKPKPGQQHPDHFSYRTLFPKILRDIEVSEIY